jgi:peptidoglycan/xylan/chitin deacetylase (PgdA/CDA1 family)
MSKPADGLLRVATGAGLPERVPAWAHGMSFNLPESVVRRLRAGEPRAATGQEADALRTRRAFTERKPVSSRLPVTYQVFPSWFRTAVGSVLGRWQRRAVDRWAAFPGWPVDLSADLLADLAERPPSPFAGRPAPVLLTHDLDSPEGLSNLVGSFLREEEAVGARSTSYVVPCAWPVDHGLLDQVVGRGHELGIHGFDHSNSTPYLSPEERRQRLEAPGALVQRYGMIGYRAPSLVRTRELLRDLGPLYRYDSSIPTSGGLFPVPNNGCASARPFRIEGIVEIPVSMPRDGSLRFLGMKPEAIVATWIDCAERIAGSGGVVVLLTHCEERFSGSTPMLDAYRRFLRHVTESPRFEWSTPGRVLEAYLSHERSVATQGAR